MSTLQKYYIAYDGSRTTDERSGCFDEVYYKAAEVEAVFRPLLDSIIHDTWQADELAVEATRLLARLEGKE